jgi:hypothetical protein
MNYRVKFVPKMRVQVLTSDSRAPSAVPRLAGGGGELAAPAPDFKPHKLFSFTTEFVLVCIVDCGV